MSLKVKYWWILTLAVVFSMVAAQCGAPPAQPAAPAKTEEAKSEATTEAKQEYEDHTGEVAPTAGDEHTDVTTSELAAVSLEPGEKLKVMATNSIVANMVKNVGGDLIDLSYLLPVGSDPHSFQATPQDIAQVAAAHVLFANGLGLEEFLSELITNAGGQVALVSLSEGVETRRMGEAEMAADEHGGVEHAPGGEYQAGKEPEEHVGDDGEHAHAHSGTDPHTWTTPANAIVFVQNVEKALSILDPANAATYKANTEQYQGQLKELDGWIKAQIETIPAENRKLVTDHTVFGYYADRYGLEQVGAVIPSLSTAAESSAQELAALEEVIKEQGVKAIFVGNTVNPALEQRVAEDTGLKLVTLFTESLGPEGSGVETYLDYTRYNTNAIVEALK